jgi:hypothetical protein
MSTEKLPPPTPEEFYISYPLYELVTFDENQSKEGWLIKNFRGTIDTYCPWCESHSIFSRIPSQTYADSESWVVNHTFSILLKCLRNSEHGLHFYFRVEGRSMQKVGQFPSLADLNLFDVKKYSAILEKPYFRELTRAIGLAAHGIGVGSFVYLRRIFESLIEIAHQDLSRTSSWNEEAYIKAYMSDKIQMLAPALPEFLVQNRAMYGILSKGIHELTEDECLKAFPVLKVGIEIILDAKLRTQEEQIKLQEATKAIQRLAAEQKTGLA